MELYKLMVHNKTETTAGKVRVGQRYQIQYPAVSPIEANSSADPIELLKKQQQAKFEFVKRDQIQYPAVSPIEANSSADPSELLKK